MRACFDVRVANYWTGLQSKSHMCPSGGMSCSALCFSQKGSELRMTYGAHRFVRWLSVPCRTPVSFMSLREYPGPLPTKTGRLAIDNPIGPHITHVPITAFTDQFVAVGCHFSRFPFLLSSSSVHLSPRLFLRQFISFPRGARLIAQH